MVCTFVERCPKLLSFSDQELDQVQHVHEEFLGHQTLSREDIYLRLFAWDDTVCYEVGED